MICLAISSLIDIFVTLLIFDSTGERLGFFIVEVLAFRIACKSRLNIRRKQSRLNGHTIVKGFIQLPLNLILDYSSPQSNALWFLSGVKGYVAHEQNWIYRIGNHGQADEHEPAQGWSSTGCL